MHCALSFFFPIFPAVDFDFFSCIIVCNDVSFLIFFFDHRRVVDNQPTHRNTSRRELRKQMFELRTPAQAPPDIGTTVLDDGILHDLIADEEYVVFFVCFFHRISCAQFAVGSRVMMCLPACKDVDVRRLFVSLSL